MAPPTEPDPAAGRADEGDGQLTEADQAEIMALLEQWEEPDEWDERPLPSRLVAWSRSSLLGAVITGSALGLREVYEPKRDDEIVIEVDADGEPTDLPIQLFLNPDDPAGSLCVVRRDSPPPVV